MGMIPHKEFKSASEILANAAMTRKRFFPAGRAVDQGDSPAYRIKALEKEVDERGRVIASQCDRIEELARELAGLKAEASEMRNQIDAAKKGRMPVEMLSSARLLIVPILAAHGVTIEDIRSLSRDPKVKKARKEAWRAVYENCPAASVEYLGSVFGRHYSSIVDAAQKYKWKRRKRGE